MLNFNPTLTSIFNELISLSDISTISILATNILVVFLVKGINTQSPSDERKIEHWINPIKYKLWYSVIYLISQSFKSRWVTFDPIKTSDKNPWCIWYIPSINHNIGELASRALTDTMVDLTKVYVSDGSSEHTYRFLCNIS